MTKNGSSSRKLKVLSSRMAFNGRVFRVTVDDVIEPTGVRARRDTVVHSGSVVILAVDDAGSEPKVLLERQYRYSANAYLWELPAGRIDADEKELAAAKRELMEETGYQARHWKRVLYFYSSPGFLKETMTIYLAKELKRGPARPEADEVISLRWLPLSRAIQFAERGNIRDAKTLVGLYWLQRNEVRKQRS